ncbi:hypothetical protein XENOCAPTIV_027177, partial [Xenoophorus captivus]
SLLIYAIAVARPSFYYISLKWTLCNFILDQAMIGVAFSLGFTVGPLMGAYFAVSSKTTGNVFYETPALLALAFSVADLLFIWLMLPETLPQGIKVRVVCPAAS